MRDAILNQLGNDRLTSRHIDELIGLARGLTADGAINQAEVEFLQKWLAATGSVADQPVLRVLFKRVNEILADGVADPNECAELLETLVDFSRGDFELGEALKSTSLPLCSPAPALSFNGKTYCFTGTFNFGQRRDCEKAVVTRGGRAGGLTRKTDVLVIGAYATDSWKHSSFGNKIMKACEFRDLGIPVSIVSEEHWVAHL